MTFEQIQDALEKSIAENPAPLPDSIARAVFTIHGQPVYAPTTAQFLSVLDDDSTPSTKKVWPSEIYADWSEVTDTTRHIVKRIGKMEPWKPQVFATALSLSGWTPPEDVLAQLREMQTKYESLEAKYAECSNTRAEQDWRGQHGKEVKRLSDNKPSDALNRSLAEIKADYQFQRRGIDGAIQPITQKSAELAAPIIKSALNCVRISMIVLEEQERAQADGFGMPRVPSNIWRAHASILVQLTGATTIEKLCQAASPRNMLAGIVEL